MTEEVTEEKVAEYSEEDLDKLVSFIKDMTILYGLEPSDWNERCDLVIRNWLIDITQPLLTIFFLDDLECELGVPHRSVRDMSYFLREPNQCFQVESFYDTIIFGTIDEDIDGSILSIIRDVYGPKLLASKNWPDSILLRIKCYYGCYILYYSLEKITFYSSDFRFYDF